MLTSLVILKQGNVEKYKKKIKKIVNTDEDFISFERLEEFHLNFQKRCGLW